MKNQKEWFEEWFDSPYYPILYKHRNEDEAERFLSNLVNYLNISKEFKIIDLACGRGRHSVFLNKMGFNVTGVDLSVQSICEASVYQNKNLHFKVADLRYLHFNEEFHLALNLFTSFGYFDCIDTNVKVLTNIHKLLLSKGLLVLDFFNLNMVLKCLVPHEEKTIDDVKFTINRHVQLGNIVKKIFVEHKGFKHTYYEKVQALSCNDFKDCLEKTGFKINNIFGSYSLQDFDEQNSERLIIIAQKC
ncbi:MAG: class I SAM-dependent methyltransferase [Bacteroidia bacterium]